MQRDRSTSHDLAPLGASLFEICVAKRWKHQRRLFQIAKDWPVIVGEEIARLTAPAYFRQDTLWIFVKDSIWMQHLQFVKMDLMERINQALTEQPITDIRWRLQPNLPNNTPVPHPPSRLVTPQQVRAFLQLTEGIANQECRAALQRLWKSFSAKADP